MTVATSVSVSRDGHESPAVAAAAAASLADAAPPAHDPHTPLCGEADQRRDLLARCGPANRAGDAAPGDEVGARRDPSRLVRENRISANQAPQVSDDAVLEQATNLRLRTGEPLSHHRARIAPPWGARTLQRRSRTARRVLARRVAPTRARVDRPLTPLTFAHFRLFTVKNVRHQRRRPASALHSTIPPRSGEKPH
jgi:hypothetical protein